MNETEADFIVIGGGIAGASIAYWLSQHARVITLERESQPGYHSTGRSAALFMASYGPPQVRALTCASRAFFENVPADFCEHALLTPRGALVVAGPGQTGELDQHEALVRSVSDNARRLDKSATCEMVPVLRPELIEGGVYEADALDIDVHALHQGFLRGARSNGAKQVNSAEVIGMRRVDGRWEVTTSLGSFFAPTVVNAAGAWADVVGQMAGAAPVGLVPKRRSAMLFAAPPGVNAAGWPLVTDVDATFYVKPDAGLLLGSPANADAVEPHDVQAEELDIAIAIDRIQTMTTLEIRRPSHVWAGLRSFVSDGEIVGGFDRSVPGLFWAAGQGGYGIQSAPAAGQLYAAMLLGQSVPDAFARFGGALNAISPTRFQ